MTENLPKDGVQSRQAVAQRCCLKEIVLSNKREFMKNEVLDQIGQNTFEISYTGRVPWCGLDKYIVSVSPYLDMTLSGGISIEIFSTGDCFTVNYMQRSADMKYLDRVGDLLKENQIPHIMGSPVHFEISSVSMP